VEDELKWGILTGFASNDIHCFTYQDALDKFPDYDRFHLNRTLSSMVDSGMLLKLKQGMYYIIPDYVNAKDYMPDWHLMAKYLMKGKEYYIGYYSAMQIHSLITQPSMREIVVTGKQEKPSSIYIKGIEYKFVTHKQNKFFGFKNIWINKQVRASVSDLEKTIVDACTKPHLCGGMVEVGKAIAESNNKIDFQKLRDYFIQNESHAAVKRYLFISDLIGLEWTAYHESMLQNSGNSYALLDTSANDEGSKNSRFMLKINVDLDTIKNSLHT
jgi:predicted transcriptional regulator of viral defense system